MKEQLIELAKGKGFSPIDFLDSGKDSMDWIYYLWLCELQKWLREEHKLHIVLIPNLLCFTYKIVDIQDDPSNQIERPPYKNVHSMDYDTYEEALEMGLVEVLKSIK